MTRSDLDRLRDARDYATHARSSAGGLSGDVLAEAVQPQHAALYALAVVGEALSKEVKSAAPGLPWKAIVDLRNIIVHGYWQIDLEIIADIIENRVNPLIAELNKLIELVEREQ